MTMLFEKAAKEYCEKISAKDVNSFRNLLQEAEEYNNISQKEQAKLLLEKKWAVTDTIKSFYQATVVSRYEDSVDVIEDYDKDKRNLRKLDFKGIMKESFFWGPNKKGNKEIA